MAAAGSAERQCIPNWQQQRLPGKRATHYELAADGGTKQLRALELGLSIWAAVADAAPISVDTPADLEQARAHARNLR